MDIQQRLHQSLFRINRYFTRLYLTFSVQMLGKLLAKASQFDSDMQAQIEDFREGAKILFKIDYLPAGYFNLLVHNQRFQYLNQGIAAQLEYDLVIRIKHPKLAFQILALKEGNADGVAQNRFVTNGDATLGIRFINCLEILEAHLLPSYFSQKLLRRHRPITPIEKISFIKKLVS